MWSVITVLVGIGGFVTRYRGRVWALVLGSSVRWTRANSEPSRRLVQVEHQGETAKQLNREASVYLDDPEYAVRSRERCRRTSRIRDDEKEE